MKRPQNRTGFSLIELLVVIGIIAVLIAIMVPTIGYMHSKSQMAAMQQTLNGVVAGLDLYHGDFNMYPPSSGGVAPLDKGGKMLAQALLGYLDWDAGNAGDGAGPSNPQGSEPLYGFRMNKSGRGKVYGPYVSPKLFDATATSTTYGYLRDSGSADGGAILYYRANTGGSPTGLFASGTGAVFNMDDNAPTWASTSKSPNDASDANVKAFRKKLGIKSGSNTPAAGDAVPMASTYLLVSPGVDGVYFTGDDVVNEIK